MLRALRSCGASSSDAGRITSISPSASDGWVSQVSLRRSHSVGPRLPNRRTNAAKPAVNSGDDAGSRESSHIAWLGAAESTSPMPVISVSAREGSSSAWATAASTPGPIELPPPA